MHKPLLVLLGAAAFALTASAGAARAQTALAGLVSSAEEGPMEGVLVTAKKDGATLAVTVVPPTQGHYGFPAARLEPATTRCVSARSVTTSTASRLPT